jgi:hypothetical protein
MLLCTILDLLVHAANDLLVARSPLSEIHQFLTPDRDGISR